MHHGSIATLSLLILAAAHTGCMTAVAAFQPENIGGATIVLSTTGTDGKSRIGVSALPGFVWVG